MGQGILLQAGTNEMELLVFQIGSTSFGINVAKVRELIVRVKTNRLPYAHASILGTFSLRDSVLTLVDLGEYLGIDDRKSLDPEQGLIIIVEFNKVRCGILVDSVEMIHRIRWDDIEPPSGFLTDLGVPLTGVARIGERVLQILDFEAIIGEVLGDDRVFDEESIRRTGADRKEVRVQIVDDSPTIRATVERLLRLAGFQEITVCTDGQHAWDVIEERSADGSAPFDIILTDIEMPRMDGLHLTARIKQDPSLRKMPVVLFSSLISPDNVKKGQEVEADAQVTKLEGDELIRVVEDLLGLKAEG